MTQQLFDQTFKTPYIQYNDIECSPEKAIFKGLILNEVLILNYINELEEKLSEYIKDNRLKNDYIVDLKDEITNYEERLSDLKRI